MSTHHEWLKFIEVSGPFLAPPVLKEVFPQGPQSVEPERTRRLRKTYDEWREAVDQNDKELPALHEAWILEVLRTALEMGDDVLRRGADLPERLKVELPEHGETVSPDMALVNHTKADAPLLLIHIYEPDAKLDDTRLFNGLAVKPGDRMVSLLRATNVPLGMVTNGERWMLVHAPVGSVSGFANWYARYWSQEPDTLRAFVSLLGVRRFFGPEAHQLPTLYKKSLDYQEEVTETLGKQVRRAVEVLIQALDRADQDRNRELLRDVPPRELYEAALTVMMRLVFLLAAEERGLLLLGEHGYDQFYAVSSLRMQLLEDEEEILDRRYSAWSRLLALFRGIYGGMAHSKLTQPALGGALFDPDGYPFLEGRKAGASWRTQAAKPLPIDDRTVLLLLEAIQTLEGRTLSYRALDVEQIGHVYEGLLERTVERVKDVTLELKSGAKAKNPLLTLGELEEARINGKDKLVALIKGRSERSASAIGKDLERKVEPNLATKLLTRCRGSIALRDSVMPYANLLQTDPWRYPLVHQKGAFVVVLGTDRRESGTHYTPKSLTEKIVAETLAPLVYRGPAEGKARGEWELKSAEELLELKICDPAMGSGAFLVQACRWLAERLVEAWAKTEASGKRIDSEGRVLDELGGADPLPQGTEERAIVARRLVAQKCLYGVDKNPAAVKLANLSMWLTTIAKDLPFAFLAHNLRSGDSLLGIRELDQLIELDMHPEKKVQSGLFGQTIRKAVDDALILRIRLRAIPIRDIRDVEAMGGKDMEARDKVELPNRIADALVGIFLAESQPRVRADKIHGLAALAGDIANKQVSAKDEASRDTLIELIESTSDDLKYSASVRLAKDAPDKLARQPFHWPLEFPEVFQGENGGFDAFVGNPPFLGGQRISGAAGTAYRAWLVSQVADGGSGSADLVTYFFLRTFSLLKNGGHFGLLAVNTISEGDTRQVGLEPMLVAGATIHAAYPDEPWAGTATVVASRVHIRNGNWGGDVILSDKKVEHVSAFLTGQEERSSERLKANSSIAYIGTFVRGMGFVLDDKETVEKMLSSDAKNKEVILPYINGDDLNSSPTQSPRRHIISFWDWSEERAKHYKEPYAWLEEHVKPERQERKSSGEFKLPKHLVQKWWLHKAKSSGLYHAVGRGNSFEKHPKGWNKSTHLQEYSLVAARTSKYFMPFFAKNNCVYQDSIVLMQNNEAYFWAFLFSNIAEVWIRSRSSTLGFGFRFAPSDALETLALPAEWPEELDALGERGLGLFRTLFAEIDEGITGVLNALHDSGTDNQNITALRQARRDTDSIVLGAYGWEDMDLAHGFHQVPYLPENDNVRFTVSEEARFEIIRRLATLNRERFQKEVEDGLHGKKRVAGSKKPSKARGASGSEPPLELGDTPSNPTESGD